MFERFIEHDTEGTLKALTLEWMCPKCSGMNFRILTRIQRDTGEYHTVCRYCRAKYRVQFKKPEREVEGEKEFLHRIGLEDFNQEEQTDMIRDFAEIATLRVENAKPEYIQGKWRALEEKIAFAKRLRRQK